MLNYLVWRLDQRLETSGCRKHIVLKWRSKRMDAGGSAPDAVKILRRRSFPN